SDRSGLVTGIMVYQGTPALDTGSGKLWTSSGTRLSEVNLSFDPSIGWHQAFFPTPIPIEANTTYVISYSAFGGRYAADPGYFESASKDNGPLRAPRSSDAGGNGVIGAPGRFPNETSMATNYWVDVMFSDTEALAPQVLQAWVDSVIFGQIV